MTNVSRIFLELASKVGSRSRSSGAGSRSWLPGADSRSRSSGAGSSSRSKGLEFPVLLCQHAATGVNPFAIRIVAQNQCEPDPFTHTLLLIKRRPQDWAALLRLLGPHRLAERVDLPGAAPRLSGVSVGTDLFPLRNRAKARMIHAKT